MVTGTQDVRGGAWSDAALEAGCFAIVPDDGPPFVCRTRQELLAVLACDYIGRSDYGVAWRTWEGTVERRRAGRIEPSWGIAPIA